MRFMIIVRANADSEAGAPPPPGLMEKMAAFHGELARAGVLLDANGLQPSAKGWRVRHAPGQRPSVIDGPFAETKEMIAGYTLIQVRSREEAMEWSRRFPAPFEGLPCEVEVRQLFELDDFAPIPGREAFRELQSTRG